MQILNAGYKKVSTVESCTRVCVCVCVYSVEHSGVLHSWEVDKSHASGPVEGSWSPRRELSGSDDSGSLTFSQDTVSLLLSHFSPALHPPTFLRTHCLYDMKNVL